MNRFRSRVLLVSLVLVGVPGIVPAIAVSGSPKGSQAGPPDSPAEFFPPHTYLYLQLHPFASVRGVEQLKLARLLQDPLLRSLIDDALRSLPREADPRRMLARYPFDKAVADGIGIGLVGFRARGNGPDGRARLFPEAGALSADTFENSRGFSGRPLMAVRVTDTALFRRTLVRLLVDSILDGEQPAIAQRQIAGVDFEVWDLPGSEDIYSAFVDGYFLAAQSAEDLVAAVRRREARRPSLHTRTDFRRFTEHRGDHPAAAFLHLGIDSAIELFGPMIPRADRKEIARWGGFDFAGLQLGIGFADGGVCEWMHLAFAENPRGLLMNLTRLWPATGVREAKIRRGTVYTASLTFDWAAFANVAMSVLDLCDVDTAALEREARAGLGMDLREDLLSAFGNTVGAVVVMPNLGIIPELSLVFKVRNRTKMQRVLAKFKESCRDAGIPMKEFNVPGGGPKATYLNLGSDIPVRPAFVLSGDKLVVSMMPLMLKYAIRDSRTTGEAVVDLVPDASSAANAAKFSYFLDPAPMTENLYADLLKILDSTGQALPFEVTDLPSPEFVAAALSRFGIAMSVDPYFLTVDLHSPTGIVIPTIVGAAIAADQQSGARRGRSEIHTPASRSVVR